MGRAADARSRLEGIVAAVVSYFGGQPHLFDLIQHSEVMQGPGHDFPWQAARDEAMRLVKQVFEEGRKIRDAEKTRARPRSRKKR